MPHVILHFVPWQIGESTIITAKVTAQEIVSRALSSASMLRRKKRTHRKVARIRTPPEVIYVYDRASSRSDVNPAPFELVVEAGQARGRNPKKVARLIAEEIRELKIIPAKLLGPDQCCVWVRFSGCNGFAEIRPYDE